MKNLKLRVNMIISNASVFDKKCLKVLMEGFIFKMTAQNNDNAF